jgi:uncharacterized phiE125 gp8 family phage protein
LYFVAVEEGIPGWLQLQDGESWPTHKTALDAVQVEFTAGYGDTADTVPATARQVVKLLLSHWYENREGVLTGTISKPLEFAISSLARSLGTGFVAGVV